MNYLRQKSTPEKTNDIDNSLEADLRARLISDVDLVERGEVRPLRNNNHGDEPPVLEWSHELSNWDIAKYSLYLTPLWFLTEVNSLR